MPSNPPTSRSTRVIIACRNCRQRKVRCTGEDPCKDCQRLGKPCVYPPSRRRRKYKGDETSQVDGQLLSESRTSVQDAGDHNVNEDNYNSALLLGNGYGSIFTPICVNAEAGAEAEQISRSAGQELNSIRTPLGHSISRIADAEVSESRPAAASHTGAPYNAEEFTTGPSLDVSSSTIYHEDRDLSIRDHSWELHEPWSWLSVCSEAGTRWIRDTTGSREYVVILNHFVHKLKQCSSSDRALSMVTQSSSEEDEATAWGYVDAFYRNCWEAEIGIIDRPDFELQLQAHFRRQTSEHDAAWHALRNIIFASGCRSLLAKSGTISFADVQTKANQYFKNALSVFTELLLSPSALTAIQALSLMACYVEGLGSPPLKHILCSNAVHLAQIEGLHRQPEETLGLSEDEVLKRNWLWWTVYTLEKHLSFCSSRPSAIGEENINARVPTALPRGSNIHMEAVTIATRHAQISSQIADQVLSAKANQMSICELVSTINGFHDQLKQLLQEIPADLKIDTLARSSFPSTHLMHMLYLHVSIYGSLMVLHEPLFYPWMLSRFGEGYNTALESQVTLSSDTVAEAARQIILAVRLFTPSAATPSWLGFHYPIHALINLFVYVLRYPTSSTTRSDLGLLDVCAGHFGYIDFLTSSQISVSLPRESVAFASKVIKTAKAEDHSRMPVGDAVDHVFQDNNSSTRVPVVDNLNLEDLQHESSTANNMSDFMGIDRCPQGMFSLDIGGSVGPTFGVLDS